jgi:hypothetical protein
MAWAFAFMLDLVFAIYCLGLSRYTSRPWQLFDTIVTLLHLVGTIASLAFTISDPSYQLSVLRFAGLTRCLHVINWLTMYRYQSSMVMMLIVMTMTTTEKSLPISSGEGLVALNSGGDSSRSVKLVKLLKTTLGF